MMKKEKKSKPNLDVCQHQSLIFKLNEYCLTKIFSFLAIPERIRLQRVCKRWQRVSKLPWTDKKNFNMDDRNPLLGRNILIPYTVPILKQVLALCGSSLTEFNYCVGQILKCSCKDLLIILKDLCPNISSILITYFTFDQEALEFLIENFYELTSLALSIEHPDDEDLLSRYFMKNKSLKSVTISSFSDDSLSGSPTLTGSCLLNLNPDSIECLSTTGFWDMMPGILRKVLASLTKLNSFSINMNEKLVKNMDTILKHIPVKSKIKKLTIHDLRRVVPNEMSDGKCLRKFSNLSTLMLTGNSMINDFALKTIGEYNKNLSCVTLEISNNITDEGLQNITNLPELEYLDLKSLNMIKGTAFSNMRKLKTMKIFSCDNIKTRSLRSLLLGAESLEYLEAKLCKQLKNNLLIKYAREATDIRKNDVMLVLYVMRLKCVRRDIRVSPRLRVIEDIVQRDPIFRNLVENGIINDLFQDF